MTKEQYETWSAPFRKWKAGIRMLSLADNLITNLVFISYPVLLVYLVIVRDSGKLFYCILIPAVSFLLISLFRRIYSAPRPYEVLDICPLLIKETKGRSFPSRHVFSACMIGMTYFSVAKPLGILILILGILMAFIRVVGGVHFPKDVAAGAALGILFGMFYFFT